MQGVGVIDPFRVKYSTYRHQILHINCHGFRKETTNLNFIYNTCQFYEIKADIVSNVIGNLL